MVMKQENPPPICDLFPVEDKRQFFLLNCFFGREYWQLEWLKGYFFSNSLLAITDAQIESLIEFKF